jgi:hypothetical protein
VSLEEMLLRDELRREATVPGEVERLLTAIARRLEDAGQLLVVRLGGTGFPRGKVMRNLSSHVES